MKQENIFEFKTADDSPGFLLWRAHNFWQRELRRALKEFGLTHTQFVVLAGTHWLNSVREEVTQVEVAGHTKTDVMLTSNVIRALMEKGLVDRAEHSRDTRAKRVFLTPEGLEVLKPAVKKVEAFDREFFSKLEDMKGFNAELIRLVMDRKE